MANAPPGYLWDALNEMDKLQLAITEALTTDPESIEFARKARTVDSLASQYEDFADTIIEMRSGNILILTIKDKWRVVRRLKYRLQNWYD